MDILSIKVDKYESIFCLRYFREGLLALNCTLNNIVLHVRLE